MDTTVYQRIRMRREMVGLTQSELAQKVGYTSKAMICQIEAGKINVPEARLAQIAEALDCSVEWFYNKHSVQSGKTLEYQVLFTQLSESDQELILNLMRSMVQKTNTHSIGNNLPEGEEDNGSEVQNNN